MGYAIFGNSNSAANSGKCAFTPVGSSKSTSRSTGCSSVKRSFGGGETAGSVAYNMGGETAGSVAFGSAGGAAFSSSGGSCGSFSTIC